MTDFTGLYFDRYHILGPLGEGGMASVYKAYDTRLERDVAVKIIRTDMFIPAVLQQVLKRFEREAKSLAKLSHPNIVSIVDYGEHEGVPYLVMEYLPGGNLKDRLKGQPLPWQDSFHMILPIARALQFSHKQGIIHRDVKPSNILITLSDEPMLSDFGIAKILEGESNTSLTGTGVGIGTPEYMAPEQWVGKTSPQSDLYSLGVVLYEMVTGRKPYTADTPAALLLKQANDPLPRPRFAVPDLPDRVEKVILKALSKKPEERYSSMEEFIYSLENLLGGHAKTRPAAPAFEKPMAEGSAAPVTPTPPENLPGGDQTTRVARKSEVERAVLEEQARQKAALEEKVRQETEEKSWHVEQARQKAALEEKIRREAEEKPRLEEQARQQAALEEKRRLEAEEKARLEEQARQKAALEEKARLEAEEKARLEEQARQQAALEEKRRLEAEEKARLEEQARQKAALEEKMRLEAEEKARLEEQARQQAALEEKRRLEAEEKARLEEQARQKAVLEEKARLEAEEKSRREAREREKLAAAQPGAEITQLQTTGEATLAGGEWKGTQQTIPPMSSPGPGGQAAADRLQKRHPKAKIPVWIWAVIGVAGLGVVGVIFGVAFLSRMLTAPPSAPANTPLPLVQATEIPTLQALQTNTPTRLPNTPTYTAVSTDTPLPPVVLRINANVRTGPGTLYPIKTVLNAGTQVQVVGRNRAGDWLVIALPGNEQGWIALNAVQGVIDVNGLPEISAPPPPTQAAAPTQTSGPGGPAASPEPTLAPP